MESRYPISSQSTLKPNRRCPRDREINILLLGQTGVGKSTFINAFANYITYDTLEDAVGNDMQVVIPSSFSFTNRETFDNQTIIIGAEDEYESFSTGGQSATQQCRSFVFPVGNRNLRFIDTPGIGDTRGIEKDTENFQEILNYISQYEHLNAIFIMLKPNEERLNILFRFSVKELLRHLDIDAKDNLMFVFTNARSTFFMPGSSKKLLEGLLDKHYEENNVRVPFSKENTFLFDSEAFRYLALCKNGVDIIVEEKRSYKTSWDHSVTEYSRLMKHVNTCGLHAISNIISLNEAEQLIRKLPRPIAETAKLIEENIQLAQEFKRKVLENPEVASQGIPQNDAVVVALRHPRTVCMGDNCCEVIDVNGEKRMRYLHICHDECYLNGVEQETLSHPKLEDCTAMEPYSGDCTVCGCHWVQHKHITYEYSTERTHIPLNARRSVTTNEPKSLADIDKRISDLREEERQIRDVYKRLVQFLHENAIMIINDDFINYLQYFLREEKMKKSGGAHNDQVIDNLEKMMTEFNDDMVLFKKISKDGQHSANSSKKLQPEDIFDLVNSLYQLPITGKQIQEQVRGIRIGQENYGNQRENYIELPPQAASSKVMRELKTIVSSN